MEGRGVTNYDLQKPSFAYSTSTTEFDDELIRRGIVSLEAAMMAKGASLEEARRLASLKRNGGISVLPPQKTGADKDRDRICDSDPNDDEANDEFLANYRKKRLQELAKPRPYGEVFLISRPDWTREVNEASFTSWVVVSLTSSNSERTGCCNAAIRLLANKYPTTKFVWIPSHAAIANWPEEHLPTIFCYRHGTMQHQLLQLQIDISVEQLEWKLAKLGVLDTELDETISLSEPAQRRNNSIRGTTAWYRVDDEDDFDDVD